MDKSSVFDVTPYHQAYLHQFNGVGYFRLHGKPILHEIAFQDSPMVSEKSFEHECPSAVHFASPELPNVHIIIFKFDHSHSRGQTIVIERSSVKSTEVTIIHIEVHCESLSSRH